MRSLGVEASELQGVCTQNYDRTESNFGAVIAIGLRFRFHWIGNDAVYHKDDPSRLREGRVLSLVRCARWANRRKHRPTPPASPQSTNAARYGSQT